MEQSHHERRKGARKHGNVPQMRDMSGRGARATRSRRRDASGSLPQLAGGGRRRGGSGLRVAAVALGALVVLCLFVLLVPPVRDAVLAPFSGGQAPSEADAEMGTVMDEDPELVPMAQAAAFTETTEDGLKVTAPDAFLEGEELGAVQAALDELEADGSNVAFVMLDLESGRGIRYNDEMRFYSASSIKVAVCTMIFEQYGSGAGYSGTIENALVWSSNDDFSTLVNTFGFQSVSDWLVGAGAPDAAVDAAEHLYVDISATEMANIWTEVWSYGTSGEAGSEELAGYLAQTVHSPIGDTLRDTCEVWSKPGWYPDDSYNLSASNDAGIVFSDEGDYVLVVLSDIGDNTDALIPLIEALDAAHASMCGDELVEP